jgi:uncharacterized protein with FMN-binding domain
VNRPLAAVAVALALFVPAAEAAKPKPKPKPKAKVKPKPKPVTTPADPNSPLAIAERQAAAAVETAPGTVRGANVSSEYGFVQITIVYKGTQVTDCDFHFDTDRPRSVDLMGGSFPTLCKEALEAQTARIHTVSGATLTSNAFIASLQSALVKAHLSTVGAVLPGPY